MLKRQFRGILMGALMMNLGLAVLFADGRAVFERLSSPAFLALGTDYTGTASPQGDILNPAASALNQRITLDLNYIGLGFDEGDPGFSGFNLNAGAAIPTKGGVFSISGAFRHSPEWKFLNLGNQFNIHTSFSKELYDDFLAGIGLNLSAGNGYGFALDIGVIHFLPRLEGLNNFRWAAALKNFGYFEKTTDYPSPYSLALGAAFTPLDSRNFTLNLSGSLFLPTFQNVILGLGADLTIARNFGLALGLRMDAKGILNDDYSGLIPSFGLYYKHSVSITRGRLSEEMALRDWTQSELRVDTGAGSFGNGLWAIGGGLNFSLGVIDRRPPEIRIDSGFFRFDEEGNPRPEAAPEGESPEAPSDSPEGEEGEPVALRKGGLLNSKGADSHRLLTIRPAKEGRRIRTVQDATGVSEAPEASEVPEASEAAAQEAVPAPVPAPVRGLVSAEEFARLPVREYISPNNDGIYDFLTLPLSITDSRYVSGYALVIQNEEGLVIRRIENKEERPENRGFMGFFRRLFSVKTGITLPESLRWDGYQDDGTPAPDGKYAFYVESWDDNQNLGRSAPFGLMVDTTPPELILDPPRGTDLIFSPDGDGNKDTLRINLSGSREDLWVLRIVDSRGRAVRTQEWRNAPVSSFVWDGRDNQGLVVPDDVYHVQIASTDRGGNSVSGGFDNIIVSTIPTPISLTINTRYFSPGSREGQGVVELRPSIPVTQGITSWQLEISPEPDDAGRVLRTYSGSGIPPVTLFDGRDNLGALIPEGSYKAKLSLSYVNGNRPESISPLFIVDITPPQAGVSLSYDSFSPNGDGQKDTLTFTVDSTEEETWLGEIADAQGNVVKTYHWRNQVSPSFDWDGSGDDGKLVPDGRYTLSLSAADRAGNFGQSVPAVFTLDTEETTVFLSTDLPAFSPNGDRNLDALTFLPGLRVSEGVESYRLRVENRAGEPVWETGGNGSVGSALVWNGMAARNTRAPDGEYRGRLVVTYEKGDISEALSRWVELDTQAPRQSLTPEYLLFSPDGDGFKDALPIAQDTSEEELPWTGVFKNAAGETVREYFWPRKAENFAWDGKNEQGNTLPDGRYTYTLSAVDRAGNPSVSSPQVITLDSSPRTAYLTAEKEGFAPNQGESLKFNLVVPNKEGISRWELAIENPQGQGVRRWSGVQAVDTLEWDGKDDQGASAADGSYRARLTVEYLKGNRPSSQTPAFLLDTTPPVISLTLNPQPFSPDNDGQDDELHILPRIEDLSGTASWSMEIYDRAGSLFKTFQGTGTPAADILWDGRGDRGDMVISAEDYDYVFQAQDRFGASASLRGKIPVDVLVIREGNRLRIQIASIQFAPDSPRLSEETQEIVDRNTAILRRLAEILKKYDNYRITIEGHAASVYWANPARAAIEERDELQPLSKARAETVKAYLTQLGITPGRMTTLGRGGTAPVAPHSDVESRWKNRRVDFLLDR
ncbi:MAG: OmpA family protein [Spirochaetales bacterium]|jgi:flagellar hook assembly protein FlgD/outer membrane protein OmpA-like peptidoglycan-associated protein|nr:OmpA family protein [Spirochaetales bacterium]